MLAETENWVLWDMTFPFTNTINTTIVGTLFCAIPILCPSSLHPFILYIIDQIPIVVRSILVFPTNEKIFVNAIRIGRQEGKEKPADLYLRNVARCLLNGREVNLLINSIILNLAREQHADRIHNGVAKHYQNKNNKSRKAGPAKAGNEELLRLRHPIPL